MDNGTQLSSQQQGGNTFSPKKGSRLKTHRERLLREGLTVPQGPPCEYTQKCSQQHIPHVQQLRLDGSQVRVGKATSTLSPQTNIVCGSTDLLLGRQTIPPISKGIAIYKYVYCILFLNDILKPILKSNYFILFHPFLHYF